MGSPCSNPAGGRMQLITVGHFIIIHPSSQYILTLVMLNKLRCHAYFQFSAGHITWARLVLYMYILNDKQCRFRSVGFFRSHAYFQFSADHITWTRLVLYMHILNDKQCRFRSVGFFRSQLIWIYTVCKGRVHPGSAGQGLNRIERDVKYQIMSIISGLIK